VIEAIPMMIFMDPPRQTRLRKLISRAFTPRAVERMETAIRSRATELVDAMCARGAADFVADFAAVLPMDAISALLGVPAADRNAVREHTDAMLSRDPDTPELPARAIAGGAWTTQYFQRLIEDRRARPGDDLVSALLAADMPGDDGAPTRLSGGEILGFVTLLSGAGNETVTKLLGNTAVLLARHPDVRARLVREPAGIPAALEESLRYWPPSQYQGRSLTRDVALHGVTMPKGSRVLLLTGAACRDEREFADADRFDVARPIAIQLAFGHGVHKCLGAALARLEARIAIEELLARIPAWSIDEARCTRVHMTSVMGFASVPATW
jgi:cytochrome P450